MAGSETRDHNDGLKLLGCVHTKCIPNPKSLYEAIIEQLKDNGFETSDLEYEIKIEMKHNVYNIKSTVAIDLDTSFKEKIRHRSRDKWTPRLNSDYAAA